MRYVPYTSLFSLIQGQVKNQEDQLNEAEAARKAVCLSHDELVVKYEESNDEVAHLTKISREKEEELGTKVLFGLLIIILFIFLFLKFILIHGLRIGEFSFISNRGLNL